jgi:hypothetical protein
VLTTVSDSVNRPDNDGGRVSPSEGTGSAWLKCNTLGLTALLTLRNSAIDCFTTDMCPASFNKHPAVVRAVLQTRPLDRWTFPFEGFLARTLASFNTLNFTK